MAFASWLQVFDTVSGLVDMTRRLRGSPPAPANGITGRMPIGQLETRLAGVVVAALKEAFDRDRARMDLERTTIEAERRRAAEALRLEMLRQAAERAIAHTRLLAAACLVVWVTSAVLIVALPGVRGPVPRVLLALGWTALIGSLASTLVAYTQTARWLAASQASESPELDHPSRRGAMQPARAATRAASVLFVVGLALAAASAIAAL